MKKLFLSTFIIFCLQLLPAKAQWVTIPDANFVNYLTQNYPSCMNGNMMDVNCPQIVYASTLFVENSNISSLAGLEYFINLTDIDCSHNQLTSLPNLPSTLITLNCSFNQLTILPQVPDLMFGFFINNNNITCLSNLPDDSLNTTLFDMSNNPITCVPNQTYYSLGLPLCVDNDPVNNLNNCFSTSTISGTVFSEVNNDCLFNSNDIGSSYIPLQLLNSSNQVIAQNYSGNGTYAFSINQPGTYKIKLINNNLPFSMACAQADSQMVNFISPSNPITNINFPIACIENYDLFIQSVNTQGWVFPGQIHNLKTNIISNGAWHNLDCGSSNFSGNVSINITGPVSYISPASNALTPTVNGNTFTYNITDFSTLTPASFGLQFLTDTTAQANDQICVHVEINPTPNDANTTNNVYDFCYNVVNSYDPNMKEVYPVNVLPGYDDWFTYTIHFQNTGNAPAFNIRLRDTLDANLDINSFEMLGYSHPAIVSINGNNLTVRFNNIMLPDSTTDYEGSMGYFQYRIKPLPNLPLGTQIENTAYIYFDYNAPIITNTTQNNFQTVVSIINRNNDTNQLNVFPNPANEVLNINLQNNMIENCIITNALGQIVYNSANEINANHKIQLNIADLNAGVYFVKVRSENGSYTSKFIKSE
jgi:uncharacterized repeat protein (TIGR01451 family)